MQDDFVNENMLKILIDQKKFLEAFRIYKLLIKNGTIKDYTPYTNLLLEVERIDPVLTMNRKTKEKKIFRLNKILNNIRELKRRRVESSARVEFKKVDTTVIKPIEKVEIKEENVRINQTSGKNREMIQMIEDLTLQSINSVMDIICGNFSKDILRKQTRVEKIEMLKEMLKRIEVIKNQRKKELEHV
ncbi:MAG: hypothetical protein N2746_01230 [Deltaproteobacteria bacterium]|nr:hypothetical protein [Deltaproteobacteria bacterium]